MARSKKVSLHAIFLGLKTLEDPTNITMKMERSQIQSLRLHTFTPFRTPKNLQIKRKLSFHQLYILEK